MSNHTQGPWWVSGDHPGEPQLSYPTVKAFINGTQAVTICRVGSNNPTRSSRNRDKANARFISAAPLMYQELKNQEKELLRQIELLGRGHVISTSILIPLALNVIDALHAAEKSA